MQAPLGSPLPYLSPPALRTRTGNAREQRPHLERGCAAAGAPPRRSARIPGAAPSPEPRAGGRLRRRGFRLGAARRAPPPGSRLRSPAAAAQRQRRGPLPRAARSVCFPCPTDVSQNIGHMFSGNKLGTSANTLGLRWLLQLPHGPLWRGEGLPPALSTPDPQHAYPVPPRRPSGLEMGTQGLRCPSSGLSACDPAKLGSQGRHLEIVRSLRRHKTRGPDVARYLCVKPRLH